MSSVLGAWTTAIREDYGSKRGWLRHGTARLAQRLGALRHLQDVEWRRVTRLVFVCTGNLCRSPYAEARARAMNLSAASFGLHAGRGPAHPAACSAARRRGLDLREHRACPAGDFRILSGDLLLGMELWHADRLAPAASGPGAQVSLVGLWGRPFRPHLQDPYGLSDEYFDTCFSIIDRAVITLARRVGVDDVG